MTAFLWHGRIIQPHRDYNPDMGLYYFHYLLIVATIAGDAFFTWFCIQRHQESQGSAWLWYAIASSLVTVAFIVYLVLFARQLHTLRDRLQVTVRCPECGYDARGSIAAGRALCPECGAALNASATR
jgi:hypothetical protein